jgi:amidase
VAARNAVINAVVMLLYDYRRKAVEDGLPDGPFRGVQFPLNNLDGWLAGVQVTHEIPG